MDSLSFRIVARSVWSFPPFAARPVHRTLLCISSPVCSRSPSARKADDGRAPLPCENVSHPPGPISLGALPEETPRGSHHAVPDAVYMLRRPASRARPTE
jgi:hypothetical protein